MKIIIRLILTLVVAGGIMAPAFCQKKSQNLTIVLIRHGEKPDDGDNLSCKGFNRSLALSKVLFTKYGQYAAIYVPALKLGNKTKSARMFQTITPYAVKYNLNINSSFDEEDYKAIAKEVRKRSGVVIMVWEHNTIPALARAFGVQGGFLDWSDEDYDTMWVITYKKNEPTLTRDREGLQPSANCGF